MAIKKSELYSSLWAGCDELRGGMDASQYKDYVLVLLFIKYISDKYAGQPYAPIVVPPGGSFKDMVALKGKSDIGDQINKKIIGPLADANRLTDMPDFNDAGKLGSGKEMVERLTNLIAIFENKALDFSKNRADGDDILGDAYEYLMRHFATESGKSKGQFYTPAEVSTVIAQIVGIGEVETSADTTVYDPTCGSGSLLLKVAYEAHSPVSLYGQEKDGATAGLARMNMILHNNPTAIIEPGNTLADPKFKDGAALKIFDYVVANPPFSDKRWSTGVDVEDDPFGRFDTFGAPPAKQGDYAYLLHIVRSLKSTGQGACKDFGYIVDYKDLFKKVENAIAVYTSEIDTSAGGASPEVLVQDRLKKGKEVLDTAFEVLVSLCEPVEPPKGELEHIRYFCGNTEIPTDLQEREPRRAALYKGVVVMLRAYASIADELEAAGYSPGDIARIKRLRDEFLNLREIVRMASGESIDLKPYEADMRHLIDAYIEADAPRKISPFDNLGLLDLIVKTGIGEAIAEKLGKAGSNEGVAAETIENNVRSKIITESLTDPAFYAKMSALLDEIIAARKAKAIEYEEYLKKIEELVRNVQAGKADETPSSLKSKGAQALWNNLGRDEALALKIDATVRAVRPDGWRGVEAKERVIKGALYGVLQDVAEVERIFIVVKAQSDY